MALLAHSARPRDGIPAQNYAEHVTEVRSHSARNAAAALRYHTRDGTWFRTAVDWAALYHDLGKLHAANQTTLARGDASVPLPWNHVDAGTAYLIQRAFRSAAITVYSHHRGLPSFVAERAKREDERPFRDAIWREVDRELEEIAQAHLEATRSKPGEPEHRAKPTGLEWRLLLSCLVDADHGDTARHYRKSMEADPPAPRWKERLSALDSYVDQLPKEAERSAYRSALYAACRSGDVSQAFHACGSPVGSGKTTSVMSYLLQTAIEHGLRHIFVVLPYTNIIRQSVDVYRKALSLPGEDPESVVAAHHHLAEFENPENRNLTSLWQSPVIVTTAVQFFETLSASATARIRKLHELPGSAVFVDEAHAAMPISLWPFMWNQLDELAVNWGCRFVLGSGSLPEFWENGVLVKHMAKPRSVPNLAPFGLAEEGETAERSRVHYSSSPNPLTLRSLADWIESEPGPRIVVMNTVQSSAILARELRTREMDVLHLSTALTPADRNRIVGRITAKLENERDAPWTLVATSCVEAGLDFDFAVGFRERCSAASLVQLGGRVNRHGRRGRGTVWDFVTVDPLLTQHPGFQSSRIVVQQLFEDGLWNTLGATELMTKALEWELIESSERERLQRIQELANRQDYPELARSTRVIDADTRLVVVESSLQRRLDERAKIGSRELLEGSVQLWARKIDSLKLETFPGQPEVYRWAYDYDQDFLGIVAGILSLIEAHRDGFFLI
ncbi:MAG: CRISPR-associated endonuclease Cas3'' [Bryobacterales bacterium]|nr:CRISPR-associated endonuclease Cas3'' [Bryobacterales bacterium]